MRPHSQSRNEVRDQVQERPARMLEADLPYMAIPTCALPLSALSSNSRTGTYTGIIAVPDGMELQISFWIASPFIRQEWIFSPKVLVSERHPTEVMVFVQDYSSPLWLYVGTHESQKFNIHSVILKAGSLLSRFSPTAGPCLPATAARTGGCLHRAGLETELTSSPDSAFGGTS